MDALRRHYERHFQACCDRISMESMLEAFAPEIQGIAAELAAAHGQRDWGARVPSATGWWSQPDTTVFRWGLSECRGKAPGPDAWRAEE
eukprot:10374334-Alexandrium_andersonii.AAC.1